MATGPRCTFLFPLPIPNILCQNFRMKNLTATICLMIAMFLASAGTVQAADDLDGKAVLCTAYNGSSTNNPVYGLIFLKGYVSKWVVMGYSKTTQYTKRYNLNGTKMVSWAFGSLNRETLKNYKDQCAVSSASGVMQKLDEIIAAAKKKNKI